MALSDIGPGGTLVQYSGELSTNVRFRATIDADEPFLIIRVPQAGRANLAIEGGDETADSPDRINLFVHTDPQDACISTYEANKPIRLAALMLSASRMHSMCGDMGLPRPLEAMNGRHKTDAMSFLTMSGGMKRLFGELLANPYEGQLARLYGEGKVMEITASLLAALGSKEGGSGRLTALHERAVEKARERLLADLAAPPSLEELAALAGLPPRRLAEVFRDITGMTLPQWIMTERLAKAAKLLQGGDLPVKEIAYRLGYAQVSTFTAAFSRHYGCPPASYRKSLITAHYL